MPDSVYKEAGDIASPRSFPFEAGTGFRPGDAAKASHALKVFEVLWAAVKAGQLTKENITHVFFDSISNPLTYGESWKRGKFWSVSAWEAACTTGRTKGLVSEHVMPRGAVLDHALTLPTIEEAKRFVLAMSFDCIITKAEDSRLTKAKLRSTGFVDNPWKRYALADIKVLDVKHPSTNAFLSDEDRSKLGDLLVAHAPEVCTESCTQCHPPPKKTKGKNVVAQQAN